MTCSIFTGCSYTQGIGLELEAQDKNLWVNILHSNLLGNTKLLNLGLGGASNLDIFHTSVDAVISNHCRYLVVQWTELLRFWINPGVETYPTSIFLSSSLQEYGVIVNPNVNYNKGYIQNIKNRFFDLHHSHYEILKVINYSRIIKKLCDQQGVTVFFINGILPWDKEYFLHVQYQDRLPNNTTAYTQQQLNANTRDDNEYFILYDKIHNEYKNLDLTKDRWLNLYSSFRECFYLDQGLDALHPGINSNRQFAQYLIKNLKDLALL